MIFTTVSLTLSILFCNWFSSYYSTVLYGKTITCPGWLGTPYRYGGSTRKGVDCSGLVNQIYKQVYHRSLERSSSGIATRNCRKIMKSDLSSGDLVFFNTSRKKRKGINHVGLFLKNGYFIHASTSRGVIISNLKEDYYRKTWKQGGRVK